MSNPPRVEIAMVHIAKCGGTSTTEMVRKLHELGVLRLVGYSAADPQSGLQTGEACLHSFTRQQRRADPAAPLLLGTVLRSPRAHVLSQYLYCHVLEHHLAHDAFPRADAPGGRTPADGFRLWLEHFDTRTWRHAAAEPASTGAHNDYNCYNPTSMMARQLTCSLGRRGHNTSAHHVLGDEPAAATAPNASEALLALNRMQHVGLLELFLESWCLLAWHAGAVTLPPSCDCRARQAAPRLARTTEVHTNAIQEHAQLPALSLGALPAAVPPLIDALTEADQLLYRAGAARVVRELRAAERATGVPLLCPEDLERLIDQTSYINGLEDELRAAAAEAGVEAERTPQSRHDHARG